MILRKRLVFRNVMESVIKAVQMTPPSIIIIIIIRTAWCTRYERAVCPVPSVLKAHRRAVFNIVRPVDSISGMPRRAEKSKQTETRTESGRIHWTRSSRNADLRNNSNNKFPSTLRADTVRLYCYKLCGFGTIILSGQKQLLNYVKLSLTNLDRKRRFFLFFYVPNGARDGRIILLLVSLVPKTLRPETSVQSSTSGVRVSDSMSFSRFPLYFT